MEELSAPGPRRAFPFYRRVAFGTANFTTLLAVSMWFTYNVGFYQRVLELPPRSAGTIILVAQIGGALSTPFIGVWSDDCKCKVPGRRKVFQLIGVLSVVVSFFFVWHECLGCSAVSVEYKVLYYSCFAIVFEFGRASAQIGQLALIPELTTDKNIQVELNSIRYMYVYVIFHRVNKLHLISLSICFCLS
jgi:Na+/melibiose symporter-like transporter